MSGQIMLRVYIDGETQPAIEGSLYELCKAAEKGGTGAVPMPAFIFNRSLNLYLPIYFEKGIRIDAEPMVQRDGTFCPDRLPANARGRDLRAIGQPQNRRRACDWSMSAARR